MWDEPDVGLKCLSSAQFDPKKVLVHTDSRTVVMEVEIR